MKKEELLTLQIALFFNDIVYRPDELFYKVNKQLGDIIDTMPTTMNPPVNAPADIPVVQSNSKNGEYGINVSRNRMDLFINPVNNRESIPDYINRNMDMIEKYINAVTDDNRCNRVGVIHTLFVHQEENVELVYSEIMKQSMPNNCKEILIRTNNITKECGLELNNIVSVEATELFRNNKASKGVAFVVDTNNIPVYGRCITKEDINSILAYANRKIYTNKPEELIKWM